MSPILALFGIGPFEFLILAAIGLLVFGVPIVAVIILIAWFTKQKTK